MNRKSLLGILVTAAVIGGLLMTAVVNFFELQLELGHAYPVFYNIDKRRRQGCRFLREIDREARRHGVSLDDGERVGCLK